MTAMMTIAVDMVVVMAIVTTTEDTVAVMIEDTMIAEVTIPEKVLSLSPKHILQVENNVLFFAVPE
jgi:hypothetical protein